jgi:phage/plasmid primase-like uncharacterized protein
MTDHDDIPEHFKDYKGPTGAEDIDDDDVPYQNNHTADEVERQFAAAIEEAGFGTHYIEADGEWHSFAFLDNSNGKQSGAAILNFETGERPHGIVWDWRKSENDRIVLRWRAGIATTIDKVSAEKKARQDEARKAAYELYSSLPAASATHPYLVKHGLTNADYLKQENDVLVVPVYNCVTGAFQTIQRIWPNGDKRFPKDAVKKGGCFMPGSRGLDGFKRMHKRNESPILICEGYATGAAVYSATMYRTLAAFDCGNLKVVAQAMAKRWGHKHPIVIAADNDAEPGREDNPGVESAHAAARAVGGKVAIPPPGDFCDLLMAKGEMAVRALIDGAEEPPAGRPEIEVKAGELSHIADLAEQVLISAGVPFYERSNNLVRPIIKTVDAFHGRKTTVAQLKPIGPVYMSDVLGRVADWFKVDKRSNSPVPIDPPHDVAATVLARAGEWRFPTIAGVITTQTMRPDGTILAQPGYDPTTRLLLIDPPPTPPIPECPTRADAEAALALLSGLLDEFPLVDAVARAVALSCLITPVVRGAFPVAPMHVADAPVAGAGKSFLLDTTAAIVSGQPMPVIAAGRSEEETEKRLGSALLASQPMVTIDNVNGELKGDALCQIIERPRPQVRILGKSELVDIEARGTTLFANGNNIVIVGDLCRRVIRARLDPKLEQPELRVFTGNPVATVLADRGVYIAAALIVCRAYIVADRPNMAPRLASFEGWSDTVRSALIWLGEADPVSSMATSRADDPERVALRELLAVWGEVFGIGYKYRVTLKAMIELASQTTSTTKAAYGGAYQVEAMKWPALNAAVRGVIGGRQQQIDARGFGNWMRDHKDRVVDGMWFGQQPDPKGASEWWVEHTDGVEQAGALGADEMDA